MPLSSPAVPSDATPPPAARTRRPVTAERMDDPDADPAELRDAFRFIRRVNRHLGGTGALLGYLAREAPGWPSGATIRLLDLGTGVADIPLAACDWARRRGLRFEAVALDAHPGCLALAREATAGRDDVTVVEGDARDALDRFGPGSFDYVHAGMFLHHLEDDDVVRTLGVMGRIATRGVVWNDLLRSAASRLGVRLLTLFASPIVRDDARLSVEKGFTRAEAIDLAAAAGLGGIRIRSMPLAGRFRLTAEGRGAA